jgi:hypothetical protein
VTSELEDVEALASKISVLLDGEDGWDVACACTYIAAFAIANDTSLSKEKRREGIDLLIKFMRSQFELVLSQF